MNFAIKYRSIGIPLLLFCLYNGLFVALLKFMEIDFPTSPINLTAILFFPLLLFSLRSSKLKKLKVILQFGLFFIFLKALLVLFTSGLTLADGVQFILYGACILSIYLFASLPHEQALKSLQYLRHSFLIFGFIYFIQYFFYQELPPSFTEIPNLFMEVGVEKFTREYAEAIIYRPNALIGNSISLGFFLNLIFSIELYYWNKTQSKVLLFKLLLIAFMIAFLFSRANTGLLFLTCIINFILRRNFIENYYYVPLLFALIASALYLLYENVLLVTLTIDRLLGIDAYAVASNLAHVEDYTYAINTFLNHPFTGISPEEVVKQEIITDGALFIFLLHFGTFGFLYFAYGYIKLIRVIKRLFNWINDFAPQLIFFSALVPYSILNSAVLNKGLFLITGIYIGIILNFYYSKKKIYMEPK